MTNHQPGFTDANGRHVTIGDEVRYEFAPTLVARVIDILQDGDGTIQYADGTCAQVKWVRLAKVPEVLKPSLPVAGYRPQSDAAIALVNEFKADEERLLRKLDWLTGVPNAVGMEPAGRPQMVNHRWAAIARTHFQEGFMALNRAVFQPARVKLPEDEA